MSCAGDCKQGRSACKCRPQWMQSVRDSLIMPDGYDEPDHGEIPGDDSQRWVLVVIVAVMAAVAGGALTAMFWA